MEINTYLAVGERKIEKNTGREQRPWNVHLHLLQSFILFLSLPSATHVLILTSLPMHAHTHAYVCAHTDYMHAQQERGRGRMSRSANYPFFSLRPSLWGCAVCNSKCTPLTINQTVYLSFQVHKGGQGAV